jgi:lysophospholipid acyltransferase (LPLAT)-like uncharacterized protein
MQLLHGGDAVAERHPRAQRQQVQSGIVYLKRHSGSPLSYAVESLLMSLRNKAASAVILNEAKKLRDASLRSA